LAEALENTIIVLIGFAGTGKYTIGRELSARTGARLIDNHLINNSLFTALNADGIKPLPEAIWDKVGAVRRVVYETICELSTPELSFIFTIQLTEGDPGDEQAFVDLVELARFRKALFAPFRLVCEIDELCRRMVSPGRAEMLKQIDPEAARRRAANHSVLNPPHPALRTIDVTNRSPSESADAILEEIKKLNV
jgi:hypothetical protein